MLDLTILMPCLNEEENIGFCIDQAKEYIEKQGVNAEILIIDNGSTDRSAEIAIHAGARVISEPHRGYGRALRTGLENARGTVVIFGDCDGTYDFSTLDPFYELLRNGTSDIVIGDRLNPLMEPGAMPWSHRWGVPFLSWCGRVKFGVPVHDFHCGLRGIRREAVERMSLRTDGMEFATEMIAEAARKKLRIAETPIKLSRPKFARKEKLRTVRDGVRHLWFILKTHR